MENKKTVVVISIGKKTQNSYALCNRFLNTSSCPVILAYDSKSLFKINEPNIMICYDQLKNKYGSKIDHFNGRWINNPAKLGPIDWFNSQDTYDYMWYFEDDVYIRNAKNFINKYSEINSDFIGDYSNNLPPWTKKNWRITNKKGLSKLNNCKIFYLYSYRLSKKGAFNIINNINKENWTNHHEIYLPYIIEKYNLSYSRLFPIHRRYLRPYNGRGDFDRKVTQKIDCKICHPIKHYA